MDIENCVTATGLNLGALVTAFDANPRSLPDTDQRVIEVSFDRELGCM